MTIKELVERSHSVAREKGWWTYRIGHPLAGREMGDEAIPEKLALVDSECSEALEVYREGHAANEVWFDGEKPEGFPVEIADAMIRLADLAGRFSIDLGEVLETKMRYNESRAHRHGGKRA